MDQMDEALQVLCAILVACVLFGIPLFVAPRIVRRFGGSPNRIGDEHTLACPKCGSTGVVRLQANRISPYPGYECRECDLRMRPPGTTVFYVVVLVVCVGFIVLSTLPLWSGEGDTIRVIPFVFVVAGYA